MEGANLQVDAELETQIEVSVPLCYITQDGRDKIIEKLDHESRMLRNLIKKLNE